ncbi:choice-of-anchor Q domain-containing protein [Dokdonella sp.]|uniref:choice-of-anchor Q domain-containing protein n=1 Tax=Dokdonella sp. TaxID=2291710 RepID=UPI001B12165A|nr:choice-of-anchor Q domain-containing protein [Dokdonella sp.]MBO9663957.1 hypothetical protein [Dokdonella sp.]
MRKNSRSSFLSARVRPLSAALLMLLGVPASRAATIIVDSDADGSVAGRCTVRDAVAAANTDAVVAGCAAGSGADTIQFATGIASITLTKQAGGSLLISSELVLDGQASPVTLRRDAADATFRIVDALETAPLTLRSMKITGGRLDEADLYGGGAGVLARGDLTLERSEVSSNVTNKWQGRGAGILARAGLELVDSVVSGNATTGQSSPGGGIYSYYQPVLLTRSVISGNVTLDVASGGGGVATRAVDVVATESAIVDNWTSGDGSFGGGFNVPIATLTLVDSTVSGNSTEGGSAWGGGGYAYTLHASGSTFAGNSTLSYSSYGGGFFSAAADISNSTISGNWTTGENAWGGGFVVALSSSVRNSTIFGNRSQWATGGGVAIWAVDAAAIIEFDSSLLFGNSASVDPDIGLVDATGEITSIPIAGGHNLIGAASISAVFPPDTLNCDPRLMPLAANGGKTMTHRLGEGSCAVDAGANPDALASDQRGAGYERSFGAATDIGALERQPADEKIFADGFDPD